jgi:hypothetical protein
VNEYNRAALMHIKMTYSSHTHKPLSQAMVCVLSLFRGELETFNNTRIKLSGGYIHQEKVRCLPVLPGATRRSGELPAAETSFFLLMFSGILQIRNVDNFLRHKKAVSGL